MTAPEEGITLTPKQEGEGLGQAGTAPVGRLFLDMDGVLADFDKRAAEVFGMPPREFEALHGEAKFWDLLYATPDFFATFDMMPDAPLLWGRTKHLSPTILTGLPRGNWAVGQKQRWIAAKLGPDVPVITCFASEKAKFCAPGDVLVDDRPKYADRWRAAGGTFVVHTSAAASLLELERIGMLPTAQVIAPRPPNPERLPETLTDLTPGGG